MKCAFAFFVFHFCMHFCLFTHLMHKHRTKYSICIRLSALNRALLSSDWQRPPARKMNSIPSSTKSVVQVAVYSLQSQMQSQQCYLKLLAQSVRSGSLLYWTIYCSLTQWPFTPCLPSASQQHAFFMLVLLVTFPFLLWNNII